MGNEAVQILVDEQIVSDEADAVRLGNLLLNAAWRRAERDKRSP